MLKVCRLRFAQEEGAVSVDWVVLTAGVCGLAISTILFMHDGPRDIGGVISARVGSMSTN